RASRRRAWQKSGYIPSAKPRPWNPTRALDVWRVLHLSPRAASITAQRVGPILPPPHPQVFAAKEVTPRHTVGLGEAKKIPQSVIARLLNVNRLTVRHYIRTRKLQKPAS